MMFSSCAFALNLESDYGNSKTGLSKTVIYVNDATGNDNNNGLTLNKPKKTIKSAVDVTPDGGSVKIAKGRYTGYKNYDIRPERNIEIHGDGMASTIIDAEQASNIISIVPNNISVTITDMTLINGKMDGGAGAVWNRGHLNFVKCNLENNTANNIGSAILNEGKCKLTDCSFKNNIGNSEFPYAIWNSGDMEIVNCDFTDLIRSSESCTVKNCRFSGNTPYGVGIHKSKGYLNVTDTYFTGNSTIHTHNGCTNIAACTFKDEVDTPLLNDQSTCVVKDCTFINNKGRRAGAIINKNTGDKYTGDCIISGCNFVRNTALGNGYGGAINNNGEDGWCKMEITGSNFTDNNAIATAESSSCGGAIANIKAMCTVTGCTFTGNKADYGGAFFNLEGTSVLHFNRIVGNSASKGSAIFEYAGIVDALKNWWGTNKGPNELVEGNVRCETWLILSITAEPSKIKKTGKSKIKADLYTDSKGRSNMDQASKYPALIPVIFSTTWGSITQNNMNYGVSNVLFTVKGSKKQPKNVLISVADKANLNEKVTVKIYIT